MAKDTMLDSPSIRTRGKEYYGVFWTGLTFVTFPELIKQAFMIFLDSVLILLIVGALTFAIVGVVMIFFWHLFTTSYASNG